MIELVGEVLQIDPPRLLSCTHVATHSELPPEKPSRLTFSISENMGITTLTITHDNFQPDSKLIHEVGPGWVAVACTVKSLLETGKPLPFQWPC